MRNKRNTANRVKQARIRQALNTYGFNLNTLDGDRIQGLGFGGQDEANNVWPLDEDINRRPYNGWRSRYGINYKLATGDLKNGNAQFARRQVFLYQGSS